MADEDRVIETVKRWEAAQIEGRWDDVAALMTEDVIIREAASLPYGGVHRGRAAVIEVIRTVFATIEVLELDFSWSAAGPMVVNRISGRARMRATGRELPIDGVELVSVRDGLVCEIDVYYRDVCQFLAALQPA